MDFDDDDKEIANGMDFLYTLEQLKALNEMEGKPAPKRGKAITTRPDFDLLMGAETLTTVRNNKKTY